MRSASRWLLGASLLAGCSLTHDFDEYDVDPMDEQSPVDVATDRDRDGGMSSAPGADAQVDHADGMVEPPPGPDASTGSCAPDLDHDGRCGADDCNDDEPLAHVGATESCVPSPRHGAIDEDCDGLVDESEDCAWHFGRPSPLPPFAPTDGGNPMLFLDGLWLSPDGLRMYVRWGVFSNGARLSRERVGDVVFDDLEIVALFGKNLYGGSLSHDERTLWTGGGNGDDSEDLYEVALTGPRVQVQDTDRSALSADEAVDRAPFLSDDGLELLFGSNRDGTYQLYHSVRASTDQPFGSSEPLAIAGTGTILYSASLTADRRTMFGAGGANGLYISERGDVSSPAFGVLRAIPGLHTAGSRVLHTIYRERTRELLYVSHGQAWGSYRAGVWRVQVCRDGPCEEPSLREACDAAQGVLSPDERHCYVAFAGDDRATFTDAGTACRTATLASAPADVTGQLATTFSKEENEAIRQAALRVEADLGAGLWIAARDASNAAASAPAWGWSSSEPLVYQNWAPMQPAVDDGRCAALKLDDGLWSATECVRERGYVCEFQLPSPF
jgi:hypothetical protein